jgi:hypothetical protein
VNWVRHGEKLKETMKKTRSGEDKTEDAKRNTDEQMEDRRGNKKVKDQVEHYVRNRWRVAKG